MNRFLVALLFSGCGSTGSGDGDARGSGADARPSNGSFTWKYDGTMHTANSTTALRRKDATFDFLDITAVQSTGDGVGFIVSDLDPNDTFMITGSHDCPGTNVISVEFTYSATGSDSPMSCTIVLTQPGMAGVQHAVGTFEAVLSNGKAITEGQFDIPIGTVIHLP
jgi:hypothetical protein